MGWIEPKTDWDPTKDRLNPESYNRIRNNLAVLGELVNEIYAPLTLESMGEEKNYSSWYYAREFNVFERNLDAIHQTSYHKVIGTTKTFFDNGPFIDSSELNRIESATLRLYEIGQNHKKTLPRLSIRLGSLKGVK